PARGGRGSGLQRSDRHAPDFSRRQQRVFHQSHLVPSQGHPATVHGHGRGPHQLQHSGAGPHHADSFEQTRRPPPHFRGSRRHHEIQEPEKGIASQTGIHRPKPFAHRRSHPRSEAADRVAPA